MNKELIRLENRTLRAYVDYFIEQYSRYMDEDDINEIAYFFPCVYLGTQRRTVIVAKKF